MNISCYFLLAGNILIVKPVDCLKEISLLSIFFSSPCLQHPLFTFNFCFPCGSDSKESACNSRQPGFDPWVGKISWRREWQPTPVFLPGEFHGQNSLASYSPWGRKKSDMVERLSLHFFRFGKFSVIISSSTFFDLPLLFLLLLEFIHHLFILYYSIFCSLFLAQSLPQQMRFLIFLGSL